MILVSAPLRVLLLAGLPPPVGGIAAFTEHLLAHAASVPDVTIDLVDCTVRWRRPTQLSLWARLTGGPIHALAIVRQVITRVRAARPDVCHLCSAGGIALTRDLVVMWVLGWWRVPTVFWTANDLLPGQLARGGVSAWLVRAVLRRAHAVVVLDERTQAALTKQTPRPIVCIPVFVRPEAIRAESVTPGPKTDLVYVGWLIAPKGVPELIDAWAPLNDVRLRLIGPYEPAYARALQTRCGDRPLELVGMVSRQMLLDGMAGATAVVLPSHGEGTPLVVLEAMALGVPVIATRVGSIPHLLDFDGPEPCGVAVPVGDVIALRTAITDLLANPTAAAVMGARGQRRLDAEFSATALFPRLVDVWRLAAAQP